MKKVLISGGSGMVGRSLTEQLQDRGYHVSWLTRKINTTLPVEQYEWDWERRRIEEQTLNGYCAIIHLAGTPLNNKRWSRSFKKDIYNSRVQATAFLTDAISKCTEKPKVFISASAAGYYGNITTEKILAEDEQPGNDFLAQTCVDWENAALHVERFGIRTVLLRTGVIMTMKGGALPKMLKVFRLGLGAQLGSGKQFFSWIHLEDVCSSIIFALEQNEIQGPINITAPGSVTNAEFAHMLATAVKKRIILPSAPGLVLKAAYGEVSNALLGGSRIFPKKLLYNGYRFRYADLPGTLKDLLSLRSGPKQL